LVANQAVGLGERESPDPEVPNLRQHDAPVSVDGPDQGAVHRTPDVNCQVVAGAEHVVGPYGDIVDRRERRYAGREHRIAVLAKGGAEGAEVDRIRRFWSVLPLLQLLLLREPLRSRLRTPGLLRNRIQVEAGLDPRELFGLERRRS